MASRAVIITGPTASGKTHLSLELASQYEGEIINADSAQMYTQLSVGTVKPNWQASPIPHHLFDVVASPQNYDVVTFRKKVKILVDALCRCGKTPFIVGGSLFYIKSLFYPPCDGSIGALDAIPAAVLSLDTISLWQHLEQIDQLRANQLHPHDRYRVERALHIWYESGEKPSQRRPHYKPFMDVTLFFLAPPLESLYQRIALRTEHMIKQGGWIDEARVVAKDPLWRSFVVRKGFIGYEYLFEWIEAGEKPGELPNVIESISRDTRYYAKRQYTFWRSLSRQLKSDAAKSSHVCHIVEMDTISTFEKDAKRFLQFLHGS